jgi:acyl dehydratase
MDDPKNRPKVPFDRIRPGDPIGPFAYELSEELVDRHRRATEQARYPDPRRVPVSLLAADGVQLADRFFDISQSVHAGQRLEVVRVPLLGEELTVRGEARDKFVKRGRRYVVTETLTTNARGEVVARGTTTGVVVYAEGATEGAAEGAPEGAGQGAGQGERTAPKPAPEPPPKVLEHLSPLVRTMTLDKMRLYEPPGEVSIHTDDAFARSAGLPAAIATGTQFLAYLFDLLYRSYGMQAVVGSELDVRIRLPVFAGDRVEAAADLLSREGLAGRLEHAVRCRTERGDAIVGRAWVPARSATR